MPDLTAQEMTERLGTARIKHTGPDALTVTDPIADTPMVVTLDQLHTYNLNPRVTRNPRYEDIKASIRERGLDAPPAITRRPGESHFIIRNGGNTRLAILRELWAETKDERFFKIPSLFRPWSARGEIIALTGHLCENELHGGLSFIERALGVEKARELYEQEVSEPLTQTELARRLTKDGYPITQSHISRMQDAVRYLLPAIPSILYAGLGKPQIERLTAVRKAANRTWERHVGNKRLDMDFPTLFHEVLTSFEGASVEFNIRRVQDELVGQMAELLTADYDELALELVDAESRQSALSREPVIPPPGQPETAINHVPMRAPRTPTAPDTGSHRQPSTRASSPASAAPAVASDGEYESTSAPAMLSDSTLTEGGPDTSSNEWLHGHIVSPAETTDRLQAIQRTIADATGDPLQGTFEANVVRAIPVQAGGLHPISDVWYIEPALDVPDRLRAHISQLGREIAQEADLAHRIDSVDEGIGFICTANASQSTTSPTPFFARAVLSLLNALSSGYLQSIPPTAIGVRLAEDLGPLLQGPRPSHRIPQNGARLSDVGVVKLFRLIRLARRLVELESSAHRPTDDPTVS